MLLYENDRFDDLPLEIQGGHHVMQHEFEERDDPREMMIERMSWLSQTPTDGVLLRANMITPLLAHFHERTVIEMMLMTRGCSLLLSYLPGSILMPAGEHGEDDHASLAAAYRRAFPGMPGIGSLAPYVVLVGETPNPRTLDKTLGVPFSNGPSGEWLMTSVGCIDIRPTAYITNAIKADGDERTAAQEIRWLRPQAVVALGQVASKMLRKAKIEHTTIVHPQYARRFHFKEQGAYVDQIRRAILESARHRA
jgi:hypothetical protein